MTLDGYTRTVTIALEPVAHTITPGKTVTLQLVAAAGLYPVIDQTGQVNVDVSAVRLTLPTANPVAFTPTSTTAPRLVQKSQSSSSVTTALPMT